MQQLTLNSNSLFDIPNENFLRQAIGDDYGHATFSCTVKVNPSCDLRRFNNGVYIGSFFFKVNDTDKDLSCLHKENKRLRLMEEKRKRHQQILEEENKRLQSFINMCKEDYEGKVKQLRKDFMQLKEKMEELNGINKELGIILKQSRLQCDSEKRRLSLKLQQYIRQDCLEWPCFLQCSAICGELRDISEEDVHLPSFLIS